MEDEGEVSFFRSKTFLSKDRRSRGIVDCIIACTLAFVLSFAFLPSVAFAEVANEVAGNETIASSDSENDDALESEEAVEPDSSIPSESEPVQPIGEEDGSSDNEGSDSADDVQEPEVESSPTIELSSDEDESKSDMVTNIAEPEPEPEPETEAEIETKTEKESEKPVDPSSNPLSAEIEALINSRSDEAEKCIASGYSSMNQALDAVGELDDRELGHVEIQAKMKDGCTAYSVFILKEAKFSIALGTNQTNSAFDVVMRSGWNSLAESIDVSSFKYDVGNSSKVYFEAVIDNPDCFNVFTGYRVGYGSDGLIRYFSPLYITSDKATYSTMKSKFDIAVKEALSNTSSSMTDLGKAFVLHDWLCKKTEYGQNKVEYATYTAYGTLVDGMGVCQSYTFAYSSLLKAAGIEATCLLVDAMNHSWNLVSIDGSFYHVDVTFDDGWNDADLHRYFMKSDQAFYNLEHYSWTSLTTYGWNSSLSASSTMYDTYNWFSYNPYVGSEKPDPAPDPKPTILEAPVITSISNVTASGATVSWRAVSGASGYVVMRSTSASGTYSTVGKTKGTSYADSTASPGRTYYYKVCGYVTNGSSNSRGKVSGLAAITTDK